MQDEALKEAQAFERELWKACNTLWAANVRQDLLYGTKLALCKTCASFFYLNSDNDHPKEHVVNVQEFFLANEVTSVSKMVDLFRMSSKVAKIVDLGRGFPIYPVLSTIHKEIQAFGASQDTSQSLDRVELLCVETAKQMKEVVDQQNKTICDLRCEVEELREQNEELMLKMMKLKAKTSFDKRALTRLANHMLLYCEECQCEQDQCDHTTPNEFSENKTK